MSALFAIHTQLDVKCTVTKRAEDLVRLGPSPGTVFEIVHIAGETAWIREPKTFANECLAPVARLWFVDRPSLALEVA